MPVAPVLAVLALATLVASACRPEPLEVPTAEEVESYYEIPARVAFDMNGNVAEIEVRQPWEQLNRGGALWARVGPYIYLFSSATRDLFTDFDGLAAVRVTTLSPDGTRIARATLSRDALNAITWKRALNVSGHARKGGSRRPALLEDLVNYGEDLTEFEYNADFTRKR